VLPVVEGGGILDTIDASITNSYIWNHVKILRLTKNMRLLSMARDGLPTKYNKDFNDWVLSIGDGSLKGSSQTDDGDFELIDISPDILIAKSDSAIGFVPQNHRGGFLVWTSKLSGLRFVGCATKPTEGGRRGTHVEI
jgi:hypothetical protein